MFVNDSIKTVMKILSVIALNAVSCAYAASAPAGSFITNVAEVSYSDGTNDFRFNTNPSRVLVAPVRSIALTSDQSLLRQSGVMVNLPHRLQNTGNVSDSYNLSVNNLAGDDYEFSNFSVFLDSNSNGIVDAGETAVTSISALAAGDAVDLVITAMLPTILIDGDIGQLTLAATSIADASITALNTDTVTIISGLVLDVIKTSSSICSVPLALGDNITYALRLLNIGTVTPSPLNYNIDGVASNGVILQDNLPGEVNLIKPQTLTFSPANGTPVVRLASAVALSEWQSFNAWNGTDAIVAVGLFVSVNDIEPTEIVEFEFLTQVKNNVVGASVTINNTAGVDTNLDGSSNFSSATICNTVQGLQSAFTLQSDESTTALAGATYTSLHQLTNTGSLPDSYQLLLQNQAGDDFDLSNISVFIDSGTTAGVVDAADVEVTGATPSLAVGGALPLIIQAVLPGTATVGQSGVLSLQASSVNEPVLVQSITSTVIVPGASAGLSINKTSVNSVDCSADANASDLLPPSSLIEYNLQLNGTAPRPSAINYIVDGFAQNGLLLEDIIPANTELESGSLLLSSPASAQVLVQYAPQAIAGSNEWVSFAAWQASSQAGAELAAKIGLLVPVADLDAGESAVLRFNVRTAAQVTLGTKTRNTASVDLATGSISSTEVCHGLRNTISADNSAQIRFLAASPGQTPDFSDNNTIDGSGTLRGTSRYRLDLSDSQIEARGVYLEVRSTSLNTISFEDNGVTDTIRVRLSSNVTGDFIEVVMRETGPNTGIFHNIRPIILSTTKTAASGSICPASGNVADYTIVDRPNCTLKSISQDTLTATIFDPGLRATIDAAAFINPFGVVFDSSTGARVQGAIVSIINADTGLLAKNPATSPTDRNLAEPLEPQTTGVDGAYQFLELFPGRYYLEVETSSQFSFPTALAPGNLPTQATTGDTSYRFTIAAQSYGLGGFDSRLSQRRQASLVVSDDGIFELQSPEDIFRFDMAVDPVATQGTNLVVSKGVEVGGSSPVQQAEVELGDRIKYSITVSNVGGTVAQNTLLRDVLPFGFKYEPGTAKRDGTAITPVIIGGSELRFTLGDLAPQTGDQPTSTTVTYVLKTTAGALDSDGINTAVATAGNFQSNVAAAQVKVLRTGLLSDRSILFGKVFVDANCDAVQDTAEWPIAGVRLYMENGTHVTTDENGMYSLYGVNPGQHVIKIDQLSLPTGIKAIPTETRHGADPYSRFVDLYDGEFHRADFVFSCPGENSQHVIQQLEQRHRSISGDWLLDEAIKYNGDVVLSRNQSSIQANVTPAYDGDISSGTVGRVSCCNAEAVIQSTHEPIASIVNVDTPQSIPVSEDAIKAANMAMAKKGTWLWPLGEISYGGRFMVVVREGVIPSLYLNGEKVGTERLGEHLVNPREKAQLLAWYGLPLRVGDNQLKVVAKDPFGNDRVMAERVVYHPGIADSIDLVPEFSSLSADGGRSTMPVKVLVKDVNGRPAKGHFFVTLESEHGQWLNDDIQPQIPGFQLKLTNGEATAHLRSSEFTGKVELKASVNAFEAQKIVDFVPVLRPLIAVGLVDIGGNFSNVSSQGVLPSQQRDGFNDKLEIDGRAAVFLKGKIKGDILLTLSYDTDKQDDDLFRDIDPNAYYPIYGDSSVKGFDAQSQSKLFVKLEKNKSSITWGDYQTDTNLHNSSSLARVTDTLTGLNAHYEKDNVLGKTQLNAYAARKDNNTQFEQLAGNGTATNYRLSNFPVVSNSEQITLVTIDRENTQPGTAQGLVLSERVLQRFTDYELNRLNGFLTFYEPIATFDSEGNEQFIRITYETESAVDEYTVAGIRATQGLANGVTVGVTASTNEHDIDGFDMASAFVEYKPSEKHSILAEVATRDNADTSVEHEGEAAQLEWKAKWSNKFDTQLKFGRADEGFRNPVAPVASGREEARAKARYSLTNNTTLDAEVIHSASNQKGNNDQRDSVATTVSQRLGKWTIAGGVKRTEQQRTGTGVEIDSVTARVGRGFTLAERTGKVYIAGEQEIGSASRKRVELGTEYQLQEKVSVYARAEQIDSASNVTSLSRNERRINASLGLKSDWLPSTQLYSEYRLQSAIDGRELQAVNGVRGTYEIKPKLKFSPTFEVIDSLEGSDAADSFALSLSLVDNRNKNLRQAIRIETRQAQLSDFYSLDYSYAARINLDWSALYRDEYSLDEIKSGNDIVRNTLTVGLARRPLRDNHWHSLYLLQWKEERNVAEDERRAYILSTHQNYQFRSDMTLSARLAAKLQTQVIDSVSYDSTAQLLGGRYIWGLNRRWDLDFRLGLISADVGEDLRYSAGIGANYLINKNLRFGAGFNFVGFRDDDLDSQKYHAEGLFFGLQYKFDEALFEWLR